MESFSTYSEIVDRVSETSHPYRTLGRAPGGEPLIAVETGGERTPAILISAGAHATEQAGVSAAVELIDRLETDHRTYIVPSRDPVGLNGYPYALSLPMGDRPTIETFDDVESILLSEGEVVHRDDDLVLSLIGDYGYISKRPSIEGVSPHLVSLYTLQQFRSEDSDRLEPFKGRRIYPVPVQPEIEGNGPFQRAWTIIVTPSGGVVDLNRLYDSAWAPPETRCMRRFMTEIDPGLVFDLHEIQPTEDNYHVSIRPFEDPEEDRWERRIADEMVRAVEASGTPILDRELNPDLEDAVGESSDEKTESPDHKRLARGVYRSQSEPEPGEQSLVDYAAAEHGLAITDETGMYGTFQNRVESAVLAVQAGVSEFERRYE